MSETYRDDLVRETMKLKKQYQQEIIYQYDGMITELDLQQDNYTQLTKTLGQPNQFISDYLEGIEPGRDITRSGVLHKTLLHIRNFQDRVAQAEETQRIANLRVFAQFIAALIILFPVIIYLSDIPKFFLPFGTYFTLSETWGLDDSALRIFFIFLFPMYIEYIWGLSPVLPLPKTWLVRVRNIYRVVFVVIIVAYDIAYFQGTTYGGTLWLMPVLFESSVIIREYFLIPTHKDRHLGGKFYGIYLGIVVIINAILYVV